MKEEKKNKIRKTNNDYLKYSGLAFQLCALLFICVFLGKKLDTHFGFEQPYIALALAMIALVASLYKLYLDLSKNK